jgi:hypothetical protein
MRKSLLFLLLLFAGCSILGRESEFKSNISVVTILGQVLQLESVEVSAIAENEMNAFLEKITPALQSEKDRLQKTYNTAKAEYTTAQTDLWQARSILSVASIREEEAIESKSVPVDDVGSKQIDVNSRITILAAKKTAMKTAKAELESFPTAKFVLQNLPTGSTKAISDAGGNFIIKFKNKGKYALFAHSSIVANTIQEQYYWLIWVDVNGGQQMPISLSNNNMMTTDAPENVKKITSMKF